MSLSVYEYIDVLPCRGGVSSFIYPPEIWLRNLSCYKIQSVMWHLISHFLIVKASPASSSSSSPSSFLLLLSFFFSYLCSLRYETGKRFFMSHDDECWRRAIWSVILSLYFSSKARR